MRMYGMSPELAQKLVDCLMKIVPQNINIIDRNGVIIASGEKSRIGKLHDAGLSAIRNNRVEIVTSERGEMKQGINLPFYFRDQICGVVGISGLVEDTMNVASLIKYTIELMIEQEALLKTQQAAKLMRSQLLQEWLSRELPPQKDFIDYAREQQVTVTETTQVALILRANGAGAPDALRRFGQSCPSCYIARLREDQLAVLFNGAAPPDALRMMRECFPNCPIGLGRAEPVARTSHAQAGMAAFAGDLLYPERTLHRYDEYKYFASVLAGCGRDAGAHEAARIGAALENDEGALAQTLLCYFRNSREQGLSAEMLHIHRNTLIYRLNKIEKLTGKDPRSELDLFNLICDYLVYRWQRAERPSPAMQ